jgi:hypothetical protein
MNYRIFRFLNRLWERYHVPHRFLGLRNTLPTWGTLKAEFKLRRYRKKVWGHWEWKNPAKTAWVNNPSNAPLLTFETFVGSMPFKDMTAVTEKEYFPGLTPGQALDALAERHYGNHN